MYYEVWDEALCLKKCKLFRDKKRKYTKPWVFAHLKLNNSSYNNIIKNIMLKSDTCVNISYVNQISECKGKAVKN